MQQLVQQRVQRNSIGRRACSSACSATRSDAGRAAARKEHPPQLHAVDTCGIEEGVGMVPSAVSAVTDHQSERMYSRKPLRSVAGGSLSQRRTTPRRQATVCSIMIQMNASLMSLRAEKLEAS